MADLLSLVGATARPLGATLLLLGSLLCPAAAQQPQRADSTALANRRAQTLFVRGMTQSYLADHAEAASYFEKALELAPQEPAILAALAETEAARGNVTSALYYARQARNQAPNQPDYHRTLADLLKQAGQSREAAQTYRTLIDNFPAQDDARLALARLLRKMDRPGDALEAYKALVDSTARPPPQAYVEMMELYEQTGTTDGLEQTLKVLINRRRNVLSNRRRLGQLYLKQERYAEALSVYERLLREQPNNPQVLTRLQMLYEETGQPEKAETLWDQVGASDASPDQLVTRARSLYKEAQRSKKPVDSTTVAPAVKLLREALEETPTHLAALDLLGTLQYETGAYDDAAATLRQALDANPRSPERWARAASATLKAGQPQETIHVAEEGLLLFPGRASLLRPLALARLERGEYNAALSRFRTALAKVEETAATVALRAALHAGRGRTHDHLGHSEQAVSDYQAALSLDSIQVTALRHYAFHLVRHKKDMNRALQLAQRAADAHPTDPEALDALGWVHFKRGAYADAKTYLQSALDTGTAPAIVYEHLGDLQRALGNDNLARQYWKTALERGLARDSLRQKLQSIPQP